jgi:hypothetical protein
MPIASRQTRGLRTLVIGCGGLTLLIVAAGAAINSGLLLVLFDDRPTELELLSDHIREGMTLAEVQAILGNGRRVNDVPIGASGPVVRGDVFYFWRGPVPEGLYVGFQDGAVVDKRYEYKNAP